MAAAQELLALDETTRPLLPVACGPITELVLERLRRPPHRIPTRRVARDASAVDDPLSDDDLQLALYVCYELHYRGFAGADDAWEWEPSLLHLRSTLEAAFETALIEHVGSPCRPVTGPVSVAIRDAIAADDGPSLSRYMLERGTLAEMREFAVHRSLYQLKEADPHSWALPRIAGGAQAAMAAIQYDEYGSGRAELRHSARFASTLRALGLDDSYGAHLDRGPGTTLATVNLISLFGLHRRWRGALVGHLAAFEMTSVEPMGRYADALTRLGLDDDARAFYDVHVEADAVHEQVACTMVDDLARDEPQLASQIVFGARSVLAIEGTLAERLLHAWARGQSSLRPA